MSNDMLDKGTLAKVAGLLVDLFQKLRGPRGPEWIEAFRRFLRKEDPWIVRFLSPIRGLVLPKSTRGSEFHTSNHLWVSEDFNRLVGPGKATKLQARTIGSSDLLQTANDEEIRGDLPADHLFEATKIRGVIRTLIELQPNGEKGFLLTNGDANIFYVQSDEEVYAVDVLWIAREGAWDVDADSLDDSQWREGDRVFSGNC